jgi:SagB-type dehydrogenase family enzyme
MSVAQLWTISKYASVRWTESKFTISSSVSGAYIEADDIGLFRLLHAFASPTTIGAVVSSFRSGSVSFIENCLNELMLAGILVQADQSEIAERNGWDPAALSLHRASRVQPFSAIDDLASFFPSSGDVRQNKELYLATFDGQARDKFIDVIRHRVSGRSWSPEPISFQCLSWLLGLAAGERDIVYGADSCCRPSRPYPSGGAIYSLSLYAILGDGAVLDIDAGIYRYDEQRHCLCPIMIGGEHSNSVLDVVGQSAGSMRPPVLFVVTSQFNHQGREYGPLAYNLILQEVGCLYQILYLVTCYLGLAGCALGGTSAASVFNRLVGINEIVEPIVGEFIVGLPP